MEVLFSALLTKQFLKAWGVHHQLSSAYLPQSNGRAEIAVRSTKRVLEDNLGADGSLDSDNVVRALLQLRNTPSSDCKLSPAQILFGRHLRDAMPFLDKSLMLFENGDVDSKWHQLWARKEEAMRSRLLKTCEVLEPGSKELPPLDVGTHVFIQNQGSNSKKQNKWDREGVIVERGNFYQYLVKVKGTGRLTLRNRRFLKRMPSVSYDFDAETLNGCALPMPNGEMAVTETNDRNPTIVDANKPGLCQAKEAQTKSVDIPSANVDPPTTIFDHLEIPQGSLEDHAATNQLSPDHAQQQNDIDPVTQNIRRSSRTKCPRKVYNPSTGTYVLPIS